MPRVEEELTQLLRDRAERVAPDPHLAGNAKARSARLAVRQRALVAVSAAAAVALAISTPLVLGGSGRNSSAPLVATTTTPDFLVRAPSLAATFPLTPGYLPPRTGTEPEVALDVAQTWAEYRGSGPHSAVVTVVVTKAAPDWGPDLPTSPITVDGKHGILENSGSGLSVSWLRRPGQWVSVSGEVAMPGSNGGEPLDEVELVRIAEGLIDKPYTQRPAFEMQLAPAGYVVLWNLRSDIRLAPAGDGPGSRNQIGANLWHGSEAEARDRVTGARSVTVRGRPGILGRTPDGRILISVAMAPDDSRMDISVPAAAPWTEELALRFAEGVDFIAKPMWPDE